MDLNQHKLTKTEWNNIEIPVCDEEKEVLILITRGFYDVNIKYNKATSLFGFLKIEYNETMEDYLYNVYFSKKINELKMEYITEKGIFTCSINSNPIIKKADMIRIEKNDSGNLNKSKCFEYILIEIIENILKMRNCNNDKWLIHYFTLYKLVKMAITNINRHILLIINNLLCNLELDIIMTDVIMNSVTFIEKNELLLKHSDMMLYEHQKQLMSIIKLPGPKLILYIAPTGTGKTLSPIGLSENKKIIFLCAARHVGLALAKAAISIGKKIAFAFGCESADDIRLHYFAAKEFKINKHSGGIGKVDNSIGDKVEIIICDIKSYLVAMYYMKAFNPVEDIVVYWDEPTITMDYEYHTLHEIIKQNWVENLIPTIILSSATLPKLHELPETIADFKMKFPDAEIHNIISHDCKKSIPIINKNGYVILPHYLSSDYNKIKEIIHHCQNNLSLLRYLDLKEIVEFIIHIESQNIIPFNQSINRYFKTIDDVNMQSIKLHYLRLLDKIPPELWANIYENINKNRICRIQTNNNINIKGEKIKIKIKIKKNVSNNSINKDDEEEDEEEKEKDKKQNQINDQPGIYITTKDAFTLTDGPTIFLANDVNKIAKFCIQQANIPSKVMENILEKIEFNNKINKKIQILEQEIEDIDSEKEKKSEHSDKKNSKKDLKYNLPTGDETGIKNNKKEELEYLKNLIKSAQLNETFIPNKLQHLTKWAYDIINKETAYTSDVDEQTIINIMMLKDVDDSWKVLLLMGIGVFTNHPSIAYTEIMKKMAEQQKLYLIIASSDYIYGTNYQFCHGYLSKDLCLTQEKIIQALGRIGRNNIQQNYSIRLRDDDQIQKLFYTEHDKPEVRNMNLLFNRLYNNK